MEQPALVSVSEYLRTSYDPDVDYVEGVLEERNAGEFDHSDLQGELVAWVRSHCRQIGLNAFPELRTLIHPNRYRIPDVVILEGRRPKSRILETAPLVAIEILSPEDRTSRMQSRIDDYLSIGTLYVWVIDPETRRAWVHRANSIEEAKDGLLHIEKPACTLPLREIFARMEELR
ncbi:MAG: Uma2 family endonuclease [Bryobacterales bacterium]|nr:Uma2 family endonuclease [Bryobacterales bacterium]